MESEIRLIKYRKALCVATWLSPVIIMLIGSLDHFMYELSGGNVFVGMWAPVSESVWEHLKIAFYPTLFFWTAVYFVFRPLLKDRVAAWFAGAAVAAVVSAFGVVLTQYFAVEAFGLPNEIYVHIPDFFVALCLSQAAGAHVAKYADEKKATAILLSLAVAVTVVCVIFSVLAVAA